MGGIRPRASRSSHPPAPRSPRRASENGNGRKVITTPTETAPPPVVKVESRPPRPARLGRSEPAEVITVTMTDQEQAVYAEMGISPLVLHSEEVKNPRGTIVMVARPGQDPLPLPQKTARPVSEGMPEDIPETADEPPSSVVSTINVEPIAATTLLNTSESEVTTESESGGEASTPEASVPAGRRRRRRVTTSEQLSLDANT